MKYIVANWKSNKTISEAQEWIGKLRKANLKIPKRKKVLLMYEPTSAISKQVGPIGVGQAVSLKKVLPMIKKVKHLFPQNEILYGGSVKSHNIALYLAQPEINGVVSGSASQNAEEFIKMLQLSSQAVPTRSVEDPRSRIGI
ncbi:triose-phosphate isomerase [Candidatus Microgenomates bacterium]|nr:triose-phosphate isomerase [Candidatus Microgenomates bacterium]